MASVPRPALPGPPDDATTRQPGQVRLGVIHILPAVLGVLPLGIAFGVLVTQSGLAWWWATVFAAVVFAGSLEFLLLGLVNAVASLGQMAATALLVNFRHVFYALSFPLHRLGGFWAKTYGTFALTDEAWALTSAPEAQHWPRRRILAIQATFHAGWVGSVTLGALGGSLIPDSVRGLEFAITALFLVLAIEAYDQSRSIPVPLVAVGSALLAQVVLGSDAMLVPAMAVFIAFLLARYVWERRKVAHHA